MEHRITGVAQPAGLILPVPRGRCGLPPIVEECQSAAGGDAALLETTKRMTDDRRTDGDGARTAAKELLPNWLADRMAREPARFGVLLVTRQVLIVDGVRAVRQTADGAVWIEAELLIPHRKDGFPWGHFPVLKSSGPDRALCTVAAAHIVAIVEVDTWEIPPLEPGIE